jgi:hypothetical protein
MVVLLQLVTVVRLAVLVLLLVELAVYQATAELEEAVEMLVLLQ